MVFMSSSHALSRALFAVVLSTTLGPAFAQPPNGESGPPRRPPPPEALQACSSLKSGDACSFTGPPGKMAGTCRAPEGKPLACAPARGPGGDKPPPAASKQ
jgi:hypothetical protein